MANIRGVKAHTDRLKRLAGPALRQEVDKALECEACLGRSEKE